MTWHTFRETLDTSSTLLPQKQEMRYKYIYDKYLTSVCALFGPSGKIFSVFSFQLKSANRSSVYHHCSRLVYMYVLFLIHIFLLNIISCRSFSHSALVLSDMKWIFRVHDSTKQSCKLSHFLDHMSGKNDFIFL